jgi:signal transduction histidine kinase/iron only hydrogenase large subunit-like protein
VPYVSTIGERCRVCYTCVRECPAKAIRISDGQAQVLSDRCIGCGNCVRVCSRGAKRVRSAVERVEALLSGEGEVAAIVAPSFPAEFPDIDYRRVVGMIAGLGFDYVGEVAFGADLVAEAYRKLLERNPESSYVAVSCPALIAFVERYHPELVSRLAPIVSPMVAEARVLREMHGEDLRVVFVGPCIAKKMEADDPDVDDEVDAALTFEELDEMLSNRGITPDSVEPRSFNPPHPGLGALFPISRGMLQAADIDEDLVAGDVVAADGRAEFVEALKELEEGAMDSRLLEILCCKGGCIMGAGSTTEAPLFRRRSRVSSYVRQRLSELNFNRWQVAMDRFRDLDLSRGFRIMDTRMGAPSDPEVEEILHRMGKFCEEDELNCGACGYDTCREHAVAIYKGMAESEMCLPYTIEQLRETVDKLGESNRQLATAREALQHAEKMASMGQLAAGIAHEVNNPLGVVLMYAHMLLEEAAEESPGLGEDLRMIAEQADRCKTIVSGLLDFARQNKVVREPVDLPDLAEKTAGVIEAPGSVEISVEDRMADPVAELDGGQIAQVLTNLLNNAVGAMEDGGSVTVLLEDDDGADEVRITVADTGRGIPEENLEKIFEPFFTTKSMGMGTGLGLAVTYGIVKMHRGRISVESNADPGEGPTGTTFTIELPRGASGDDGRALSADSGPRMQGKEQ